MPSAVVLDAIYNRLNFSQIVDPLCSHDRRSTSTVELGFSKNDSNACSLKLVSKQLWQVNGCATTLRCKHTHTHTWQQNHQQSGQERQARCSPKKRAIIGQAVPNSLKSAQTFFLCLNSEMWTPASLLSSSSFSPRSIPKCVWKWSVRVAKQHFVLQ